MRHKTGTIEFAQGWLGNQLEEAAKEQMSEQATAIGEQVLAQWKIIDEGLDDLIKERKHLREAITDVRLALGFAALPPSE